MPPPWFADESLDAPNRRRLEPHDHTVSTAAPGPSSYPPYPAQHPHQPPPPQHSSYPGAVALSVEPLPQLPEAERMLTHRCELCNISCNSQDDLDRHKLGRRHRRAEDHVAWTATLAASQPPAPQQPPPSAPARHAAAPDPPAPPYHDARAHAPAPAHEPVGYAFAYPPVTEPVDAPPYAPPHASPHPPPHAASRSQTPHWPRSEPAPPPHGARPALRSVPAPGAAYAPAPGAAPAPSAPPAPGAHAPPTEPLPAPASRDPTLFPYRCDLCKLSCQSEHDFARHRAGRKHIRRAENAALLGHAAPAATATPTPPLRLPADFLGPNDVRCELCNVVCPGRDNYNEHRRSKRHLLMYRMRQAETAQRARDTSSAEATPPPAPPVHTAVAPPPAASASASASAPSRSHASAVDEYGIAPLHPSATASVAAARHAAVRPATAASAATRDAAEMYADARASGGALPDTVSEAAATETSPVYEAPPEAPRNRGGAGAARDGATARVTRMPAVRKRTRSGGGVRAVATSGIAAADDDSDDVPLDVLQRQQASGRGAAQFVSGRGSTRRRRL